ncbi:MAG: hypothetical protein ACOX6L_04955 [Syntrophomonadaceae bacterium]|jgi:hypothetical protein
MEMGSEGVNYFSIPNSYATGNGKGNTTRAEAAVIISELLK